MATHITLRNATTEQLKAIKTILKALKVDFDVNKVTTGDDFDKKAFLEGFKEAVEEVNLHRQGRIKLKTIEELLGEF